MSNQFKLLESNPQLELKNGIFQDATELFRDSRLSNYIQIAVAEIFDQSSDNSLFSLDIERLANTDELKRALSLSQFQFLRAFNLSKVNTALDLSEDFGGVSHFLADHVSSVEAVKVDPDLARLSTRRCVNKHNVCHISEDLDKLSFPERHYDLIIIGQLEALQLTTDRQQNLFNRLRDALSGHGVMVVNSINSERISKWFNADSAAERNNIDYVDLYCSANDDQHLIEQSRKQLCQTLHGADFGAVDVHASFSTGADCRTLLSEDYLFANVNSLNHFYRMGSLNNPAINEFLLYKRLRREKRNLVDCANRLILLAGASTSHLRQLYDNDFSYFPGSGRKPAWRTITSRARAAHIVNKRSAYDCSPDSELVSQNLDPQPFHKGRLLVENWLQALLDGNHRAFTALVQEYTDWLHSLSVRADFTVIAYDLLPFNIIVSERDGERQFQAIDTEWQVNDDFSTEFVLFRALFWFAFENKPLLKHYALSQDIHSIGMFIVAYMPTVHQIEDLDTFVRFEERIQSEIDHKFRANAVSNALLQPFDQSNEIIDLPLSLEIAWGNRRNEFDESHNKTIAWEKSSELQSVAVTVKSFDNARPILRIDPLSATGSFEFNTLELLDADGATLWSAGPAAEIAELAMLNGVMLNGEYFVAVNDDPHFLFDLESVPNINSVASVALKLAWLWGPNYSAALETLGQAVSLQNEALIGQSRRLDQYRAEIDYQRQRIEDLLGHRADLTDMLRKEEARTNEIKHRLNIQHARNDELHSYLLMRPSTRAKRVSRRWLNRLTGKPLDEPQPTPSPKPQDLSQTGPLPDGELIGQNTEDYSLWVAENTLSDAAILAAKQEIEALPYKPVFSILVPIYNTDPEYLLAMIESVKNQIYPYWQLCLVDDCSPKKYLRQILQHEADQDKRIKIQLNEVNQGISITTNDALAMADGDYIALLDHDDEISIDALYENAKIINKFPEAGLIYSDEDKMDMQGNRLEPYFKPDYSPDLLHTNNYVCHFTVIKKSIADEIGGFREGLDGSQDHDIILRAADAAERVIHIPKILYHWRKIPGSTAVVYDSKSYAWEAGRKAVEDLLQKREDGVRVDFGSLKGTYRVFREIHGDPLVSVIIPFKDKPELLDSCLNSILNRTSYANFEIIGISNNSEDAATFERMDHFKHADQRVRFVEKNIPFNFSALCNYGVSQAKGKYVVLLNNDIEILSPDWLERMLEHAQRNEVGAVGGKLLYPNGRIQHAGVVVGMVGAAGHPHKFFPDDHIGYHGRLHMVYNVSAVTGAMMMIRTDKFHQVGGLDEQNLAVAYNDIDLCLKLLKHGYHNLFTPHAKATHHESVSRGYEDTDEKMQRLLREQRHFLTEWADFLQAGDPYYNPNLSLKNERFSLRFKD